MTDSIVFDTGPLISLSTNNLLWILPKLKESFKGDFMITPAVKKECVDRPLETKKFKFEALQILRQLEKETLKIYKEKYVFDQVQELLDISNNIFFGHNNPINIVHYAEIEVIATALITDSNKIVIDERTTRMLIENPDNIRKRLEKKLHTKIEVDDENLKQITERIGHIKVLRSTELIVAAYELGLLDEYIIKDINNPKRELLEAVLWGLKLKGCSIREDEIEENISIEREKH